jgi:hypothetical protein
VIRSPAVVIVTMAGRIAARTTGTTGSKTLWIGPRIAGMIEVIYWLSVLTEYPSAQKWLDDNVRSQTSPHFPRITRVHRCWDGGGAPWGWLASVRSTHWTWSFPASSFYKVAYFSRCKEGKLMRCHFVVALDPFNGVV